MKSYIVRAYYFAKYIFSRVNNIYDEDEVIDMMDEAQKHFHIHANFTFGSSRYVIVTKDFVIKWDRNDCYSIGLCEDELKMYEHAKRCGYDYLLAKITPIYLKGKYFYVMPTINKIGPLYHTYSISHYLDKMEYWWVESNINDLHSHNWGLSKDNKPIIIDYAFRK